MSEAVAPRSRIIAGLCAFCLSFGALAPSAFAGPAQDYTLYCQGCHGPQAQGVPGKIPPLARTLGRFMQNPAGREYLLRVPGAANSALSDAQLAAVLNWLAREYSAADLPADVRWFSPEEVTRSRRTPLAAVQQARREAVGALAAAGIHIDSEY